MERPTRPLRRSKIIVATGALYLVVGLLVLLLSGPIMGIFNVRGDFLLLFGIASVLAGVGAFLLTYLKGDLIVSDKASKYLYDSLVKDKTIESFSNEIRQIDRELANLKEVVGTAPQRHLTELSAEETAALRLELKTQLEGVLANDLVKQIEQKYSAEIASDAQVSQIRKGFEITCLRLRQEIGALSRRSNLNLVIGVLTTVVAVGMLAYLVWGSAVSFTSLPQLLSHFLPRVSVAAFIEVFSFFFLKLYKSNLDEIKYFQNELTNVEMRIIALEAALLRQTNKLTEPIIDQLIQTDRNIITLPSQTSSKNDVRQLKPKDIANLLDKLGKLLNLGAEK